MLHQSNSDFSGAREPARGLYCRGGRGRCGTLAEALERLDAAAKEVRAVGGEGLAAADVAAPRRRYAASPTASDRSSFMMRQPCTSPWRTCLRSIRRNSTGRATSCRNVRRRCRRSSSRRSPPAPSSSPHRREIYVGGPTVQAVFANMVAPGLLDRLLARKGYSGQLSKELETPGRPDNLFEPVGNGYAAHGRFDRRATDRSIELWLSEHRGAPGPALAMLSLAAGVGMAALIPIRARGRSR